MARDAGSGVTLRGVGDLPCRRGAAPLGVGGGTGDLQQLTGPLEVALLGFSASMNGYRFTGSL
jgi:hypothetical protein